MKGKIIICDDDQDNLDVLEILLQLEGYMVVKVKDSEELLDKIKDESPSVLLLDLWMPKISGSEIIKAVRSDNEIYKLPIVVFSASLDGEKVSADAGADYFVSKPFDVEEILEVIRTSQNIIR